MRWVALMPLRGGSKSIPGKNLRPLAGRPLFAWSLEQALASGCFDALYVMTDDPAIAAAVREGFGEAVTVLDRAAENASDEADSESVLLEFQQRVAFDVVALVQATSPLTRSEDFRQARSRFTDGNFDSLLTAVEFRRFLWRHDGSPLNYAPEARPRRQDFAACLMENGAFYLTRATLLREQRCRLGGRIGIHVMAPDTALEIDEPGDWPVAEARLREAQRQRPGDRQVRALVLDVDGTLTDGGMYYGARGEALKKFNTRDAKGLARLRERGLRLGVITGEQSPAVAARMTRLGITDYHPGVDDKSAVLATLAAQWGVALDEIAYMGDDLNDLSCLTQAGLALCPGDAVAAIRARADHVMSRRGGDGAVREACELILSRYS